MASTDAPRRGEAWLVALGAAREGDPGKTRPAVVVSVDELRPFPTDLIVVVPLSSARAPSALRVPIGPSGGVDRPSLAICRAVRAVVASRLVSRLGIVEPAEMAEVETALALILGIEPAVTTR